MPSKELDKMLNELYKCGEELTAHLLVADEHQDVRDATEAMIDVLLGSMGEIPGNTEVE